MNFLRKFIFRTRVSLGFSLKSSKILPNIIRPEINYIFCSSQFKVLNISISNSYSSFSKDDSEIGSIPDITEDEAYQKLVNRYLHVPDMGHQVLVVQPYVKWGPSKKKSTTPDLQLAEATSLVATLSKWHVVNKMILPVERLDKKYLFGSGNLDRLKSIVKQNKNITAVFISVNILKGFQRRDYEKHFKVPVFDRYSIVIQIFKEHAVTKNAKLQVALAEIPYLWAMLSSVQEGQSSKPGGTPARGSGETFLEASRRLVAGTETKLRSTLNKIQEQRKLSRKKRNERNFPVVAVVGYTNSGKTSLIKALTGEKQMQPRDSLFATLDVTAHEGILPCRLKLLYIDTVGFMSDLPTKLIECFVATLEDVMLADVILHVCDLSHPDVKSQVENVLSTLRTLEVPEHLINNIITVGNKIDKETLFSLEELSLQPIKISALTSTGIGILVEEIEKNVLAATQRQALVVRVPTGGDEARWLYKETAVTEDWTDPSNSQFMMMRVVISKVQLAKFKSYFLNK